MVDTNDMRHTPKSLRGRLGLTQAEVAKRASVTQRTVVDLEAGVDLRLDSFRALARALEVTTETLVAAHDVERERRASRKAPPPRKRRRTKGAA